MLPVTRTRAPPPESDKPSPETVQKATRWLNCGCSGKTKGLLCEPVLATHDARAELLSKHQAGTLPSTSVHPPEQWLPPGLRRALHLEEADGYLTNAGLAPRGAL